MRKTDIILAGVGGQGILSVATIIGHAAVASGLHLKQAETHGMSQRGGDVQSHLRLSDSDIASDLIPMGRCDIILSGEPMESLRYLPYLSKEGYLITSSTPFVNIPNYPKLDDVMARIEAYPNRIVLDADKIAKAAGSARAANVVMLGAASPYIMIDFKKFEEGIASIFGRKGADVVEANLKALRAGREFAESLIKK